MKVLEWVDIEILIVSIIDFVCGGFVMVVMCSNVGEVGYVLDCGCVLLFFMLLSMIILYDYISI